MRKKIFLFLFALFFCGVLKVDAQITADNRNSAKVTAVDLIDLLLLQDHPIGSGENSSLPVKVGFYNKILNLVGISKEAHDIMYSDKVSSFITASEDVQKHYHYHVLSGKENVLLGYSKCLDATKFRDVFSSDPTKDESPDGSVDSNNQCRIWVYLNTTNKPPQTENRPTSGHHYSQWIDTTGNEYDFYQTINDLDNNGELWVGISDDLQSNATCRDNDHTKKIEDGLAREKSSAAMPRDSFFNNVTTYGLLGGAISGIGGAIYSAVHGVFSDFYFSMHGDAFVIDPSTIGDCTFYDLGFVILDGAAGTLLFGFAGFALTAGIVTGVCEYYKKADRLTNAVN